MLKINNMPKNNMFKDVKVQDFNKLAKKYGNKATNLADFKPANINVVPAPQFNQIINPINIEAISKLKSNAAINKFKNNKI